MTCALDYVDIIDIRAMISHFFLPTRQKIPHRVEFARNKLTQQPSEQSIDVVSIGRLHMMGFCVFQSRLYAHRAWLLEIWLEVLCDLPSLSHRAVPVDASVESLPFEFSEQVIEFVLCEPAWQLGRQWNPAHPQLSTKHSASMNTHNT